MKDKSDKHGNTKSFGAVPGIDELAREFSVKAPIEMRGNLVDQPQESEQTKEQGMTEDKADSSGLALGQAIAVLAFVAALFGVSVHTINSSSNARFDDINARFDRLEIRIDERFDELEAKVDANTEVTASLRGESVVTYGSSD
ncbi:MAG: hypothetical protein OXG23_14680 [Chloroflexi bacterium]|nr:hypothetical protein [Chloroflexota bacterium]